MAPMAAPAAAPCTTRATTSTTTSPSSAPATGPPWSSRSCPGRELRDSGISHDCLARSQNLVAPYRGNRSEEHTSELQSLMRISYAVFCLKKKNKKREQHNENAHR